MQSAEWKATARLLRRTGFGTTGSAVDSVFSFSTTGEYLERAFGVTESTDAGLAATPLPDLRITAPQAGGEATPDVRSRFQKKLRERRVELVSWWLRRMVAVNEPAREKLALLWHNHFATSLEKVRYPAEMAAQNEKIRTMCLGDFSSFAYAMLKDAAMVRWLDGDLNRAESPNENLAREFLELFALGHGSGYSEGDVQEGARALTGWSVKKDGSTTLVPAWQDTGPKQVLNVKGNLDAGGFRDAVLTHPHSARFIAKKLWRQLASDSPPTNAIIDRLLSAYGEEFNLHALTKAILTDPEFNNAEAVVIISPVEWLVGLHRAMNLPIDDAKKSSKAIATLKSLGHLPFYPPSVGGWAGGQAWLSAAAAGIRLRAAADLAKQGDLSSIEETPASNRLDAAGYLLGIGFWTDSTIRALKPLLTSPPALVAAAANTPEYLVS